MLSSAPPSAGSLGEQSGDAQRSDKRWRWAGTPMHEARQREACESGGDSSAQAPRLMHDCGWVWCMHGATGSASGGGPSDPPATVSGREAGSGAAHAERRGRRGKGGLQDAAIMRDAITRDRRRAVLPAAAPLALARLSSAESHAARSTTELGLCRSDVASFVRFPGSDDLGAALCGDACNIDSVHLFEGAQTNQAGGERLSSLAFVALCPVFCSPRLRHNGHRFTRC